MAHLDHSNRLATQLSKEKIMLLSATIITVNILMENLIIREQVDLVYCICTNNRESTGLFQTK